MTILIPTTMLRLILSTFLLTALPFLSIVSFAQNQSILENEVNDLLLSSPLRADKVPGFLLGVVEGDSTYILSYGNLQVDSTGIAPQHLLFQLSSLTQVMTAALTVRLIHDQRLALTEPLTTLIPENASLQQSDLTLLNLLNHTAGLPRQLIDVAYKQRSQQPYAHITEQDIANFTDAYQFPNSSVAYHYSELSFVLLANVIEQKTSMTLSDLFTHYFPSLNQMGYQKLVATVPAPYHWVQGYGKTRQAVPPSHAGAMYGSVGGYATITALCDFLCELIEDETYKLLQEKAVPTDVEKHIFAGLGWHFSRQKKFPYAIMMHTGATLGHRAFIGYVPETKTGVVALSNAPFGLAGIDYQLLAYLNAGFSLKKYLARKK